MISDRTQTQGVYQVVLKKYPEAVQIQKSQQIAGFLLRNNLLSDKLVF